jgi:hypothetical protein
MVHGGLHHLLIFRKSKPELYKKKKKVNLFSKGKKKIKKQFVLRGDLMSQFTPTMVNSEFPHPKSHFSL